MKICTEITTLASSRKGSVFLSYNWSPVVKNEDLFYRFIKAYMRDHGKIHSKHRLPSLKAFFSSGDQSFENTVSFFNSLQV